MAEDFNFLARIMLKIMKAFGIDFTAVMPDKKRANFLATISALALIFGVTSLVLILFMETIILNLIK